MKANRGSLGELLKVYLDQDPAATSRLSVLINYPGVHAIIVHRLAHALLQKKAQFSCKIHISGSEIFTGIEIHPGAIIGKNLFIDHGMGVVIGETAEIGDNCVIYHQELRLGVQARIRASVILRSGIM